MDWVPLGGGGNASLTVLCKQGGRLGRRSVFCVMLGMDSSRRWLES